MRPSRRADDLATQRLDADLLRSWPLPIDEDGDKFSRGTVLVIGGSPTTPGAVILAGMAALRMGAGRLQIATATAIAPAVAVAVPEALVLPCEVDCAGAFSEPDQAELGALIDGADAVLIGSGMAGTPPPIELLEQVLRSVGRHAIVVIDAVALTALPKVDPRVRGQLEGRMVLTPNRQEVEALATADADDALAQIAAELGAVITSFGSIRSPDGRGWDTDLGHPSMGTSGSGDVLAGLTVGCAGRTGDAAQSACWATFIHAATGQSLGQRRGSLGFLARELIEHATDHAPDG
ncbi:MAG: YjeF-related protein [Ilumatobacteraceae bacterium]|nr:YjeF-related protein [Ilumatobacteraceae bacterium]